MFVRDTFCYFALPALEGSWVVGGALARLLQPGSFQLIFFFIEVILSIYLIVASKEILDFGIYMFLRFGKQKGCFDHIQMIFLSSELPRKSSFPSL